MRDPELVAWYVQHLRSLGLPDDQIANFLAGLYVVQTRQAQFHAACRAADRPDGPTHIGFGGARGPGKTHALFAQLTLDDCQRRPGLKCLLLRKVGKAVREQTEDLRGKVLRVVPHTWRAADGMLVFANDSRVVLGHFKDESDVDAYLGLEYDVIGVEEATTLSAYKYKAIESCCRTAKTGWRPRLYSTANPGGVGHAWYKRTFVAPYQAAQSPAEGSGGRESATRFIPATIDDNAFINPEYRATLDSLTGWLKRAWRHGDWDIAAGQFFSTWRPDVYVRSLEDWKNGRMQQATLPFFHSSIPPDWSVWLSMDYGFTHYNVIYLLAQDGRGTLYVLDELAERGWLVGRHAEAVRGLLARWGIGPERPDGFVAGRDCFAARGTDLGTIADQWAAQGFVLTPANDDRVSGAAEILRRLGDVDAGLAPSLYVSPRCARLIECLPALQHDPHRPEDVLKVDMDQDGAGGDDAYDALRYGVMAAASARPAGPDVASALEVWRG